MVKGKTLIITRPEHDPGTKYLSHWSKKVIRVAEEKGVNVIDLHQDKAERKEFEGRIYKTNPSLVFLNGHGSEDCVTGHDNKVLVKAGENEKLLKDRITYAVSCDSAEKLGKSCIDKDTAYIGYKKSFIFNFNPKYINRPTDDERAGRFLDASNQVPLSLLKGHSAQEASERSKEVFRKEISLLFTSFHSDPDSREDVKDLWWDMQCQVCLGAQGKKL